MNMIHFKNRPTCGFTLIEVLIAMAIIGISIGPILLLQTTLLRMVGQSGQQIKRILQAQTFLVHTQRTSRNHKEPQTVEKKVDRPTTNLKYVMGPLKDESALKSFKHIQSERVMMQWLENGRPRSDDLVTFIYKQGGQ